MAAYTVQAIRNAVDQKLTGIFHGKIVFPWDQLSDIAGAIIGMHERAPEGLAAAANRTAQLAQDYIFEKLQMESTAEPEDIRRQIFQTIRADERQTAAGVRVTDEAIPLDHFEHSYTAEGILAVVHRSESARELPDAFEVEGAGRLQSGIYQRRRIGGEVAGRLPIDEKFGPSPADTMRETDMLPDVLTFARETLVKQVKAFRDAINAEIQRAGSGVRFGSVKDFLILPIRLPAAVAGLFT
jgi:hypothetical protein